MDTVVHVDFLMFMGKHNRNQENGKEKLILSKTYTQRCIGCMAEGMEKV